MASFGHLAIGAAAARMTASPRLSALSLAQRMAVLAAVSMAPDLDVIAFALRIPYEAPLGHRGATHSIVVTLAMGLLGWPLARWLELSRTKAMLAFGLVALSHPLLDTMTTGGLGCALAWPFTSTRFFAPWRPIPVAPIGLSMLSARGVRVVATELVMFAPFVLYSFWPRRPSTPK